MYPQELSSLDIVAVLQEAGLLVKFRAPQASQVFTAYSTRAERLGPQDLFIAYSGVHFDAHSLIAELLGKNTQQGFIVSREDTFDSLPESVFACLVTHSRAAWAWVAALAYGHPQKQLQLIGITGTNGKTSTVWYLRQLLRVLGEACLTIGTLGIYHADEFTEASHTTPDPDQLFAALARAVANKTRFVVMEVSSHALVQQRVAPLQFSAVAFTSFSRDHLDFHASMQEYFAAKWQLIQAHLRTEGVAWIEESVREHLSAQESKSVAVKYYGKYSLPDNQESLQATWELHSMDLAKSTLTIRYRNLSWPVQLPFAGDFAMANFTLAWLLIEDLLPQRLKASHAAQIEPVVGRFEPLPAAAGLGFDVVVDYAHTPDALEKTLGKLRQLTQNRVLLVFGCGGDRDPGKRPLMGEIAERLADLCFVTSDNPRTEDPMTILRQIQSGMTGRPPRVFIDRYAAISAAIAEAQPGDAVLIAGKGHENYQIIGQDRLPFDDRLVAGELLLKYKNKR